MKIPKNKVIEFKEAEKLSAAAHQFIDQLSEANIPVTYWKLPMSKFVGSEDISKNVLGYVADIKRNYSEGKGLVFAGPYGVGKTYGLCSILKSAIRQGWTAYYTSLPDVSMYATSKLYREDYMRACMKSDFLVIDEMDARHMKDSEDAKNFFGSLIEKILRERTQNLLPTFFATNHDSLEPVFNGQHARAVSSLLAPCTCSIVVLGQDFRKKIKAGQE